MVTLFRKSFFLLFFGTISIYTFAQEGTRTSDAVLKGKVMIIPFEPLMYMSEIDKKVNEQTDRTFNEIREKFRRELDIQLLLKLKKQTPTISFYLDSIKMARDLDHIYKSRTLSYELLDPKKGTPDSKKQKKITNGQLTVEMNNDVKFMNAKIINPSLLSTLNKKYDSEYFIFINELDIKTDMESYDAVSDSYQRNVIVHYTIMDKTKKIISAGAAVSKFSSLENDPKKIVDKTFVPIADYIANQFLSATKTSK